MEVTRKVVSVRLTKEETEILKATKKYCAQMPSCENCIFNTAPNVCQLYKVTEYLEKIKAEEYREETDDD